MPTNQNRTQTSETLEMPIWVAILLFVGIPIICIVIWVIYYNMTWFRKVIHISDKFMKSKQVGGLEVSSNHAAMRTDVRNTRRTVEEYFLLDSERNIYSVEDCLLCGFYVGSFGKYTRVYPGDKVEIMGYGGYFGFDGIPVVYSVRRLTA